ncbi:hypothetical protein [Aureimonas sp. D3]|uniref:hypothetical protein n=1 Tax=Aureimonas sp. D3 TaxID=1638164 RepID=UPI00078085C3|nr:hypothetical protein [Aureimonas sp. D3]
MTEANEVSSDNNGEPRTSPALPTAEDIQRNVAEWRAEVEARVAIAITGALRHGRHPSEADTRRLSAEGRRLYHERLPKAAVEGLAVAATANSSVLPPASGEGSPRFRPVQLAAKRILLNEVDWRGRQERRPPYTRRASAKGVELMLFLTGIIAILLHALPDHSILSQFSRVLEVFQ